MNDLVKDVLQRDNEEQNRLLKSTEVIKPCPVDIDMGNLLVWDPNVIDQKSFTENKDEYIKQTMRDNMQLLVNALWQLPIERHDDVIVAKLPDAKQIVPRAKPIPKPKPLSKWQKFAQSKGIVKKKKSKFVWDEAKKDWGRRYGFNKANDESKDWVIEVPANADPNEDQFSKRKAEKKERVSKNEFQRLKNVSRANKVSVRNDGTLKKSSSTLKMKKALAAAKSSDASMGQYSEKASKDEEKQTYGVNKRKKYEPNLGNLKREKEKQLKIYEQFSAAAATTTITKKK